MVHNSDQQYPQYTQQRCSAPSPARQQAPPSSRLARPKRRRRRRPAKALIAGGSVLAIAALAISPAQQQQAQAEVCTQVVQETSRLSRGELTKLLSVPESSSRAAVEDILGEPYCLLSAASAQTGTLERQAYPLEFDIDTWFVVEYAGDRYVGYDFSFRK